MRYEVLTVMKFHPVVFWDMNADGGSSFPRHVCTQPPNRKVIIQNTTEGRNGALIFLLFYVY